MWILAIAGVGAILVGGWRLVVQLRAVMGTPGLKRLARARALAGTAAWVSGGSYLLLVVASGATHDGLHTSLLVTCVASAFVAWSAGRVRTSVERVNVGGLSSLILLRTSTTTKRLGVWARRRASVIAPTWSEIHIGPRALDRVFAPGTLFVGYFALLALSPILFAVLLTGSLRSLPTLEQRVLTEVLGYNALVVASSLTVATLLTIATLIVAKYLRILRIPIDLKAAFRIVSTAAGYGTAAGFITAALLPATNRLMPFAMSTTGPHPHLTEVLSPRLFLDIPAASAVTGYCVGLLLATILVCREAENLLVRRLLTPLIFVAIMAALGSAEIDPPGLLESIVSGPTDSTESTIDCTDEAAIETHLEDDTPVLVVLMECGAPITLDRSAFFATIAVLVSLGALLAIARDVRQALNQEQGEEKPTSADGTEPEHDMN